MVKENVKPTMSLALELSTFIGMLLDKKLTKEEKEELVEMRYEQSRGKKCYRKKN